jgi:Mg-chelatase subunit ChlD
VIALSATVCAAAEGPQVRERVEIRLRTAKIRIVPSKSAAPGMCSQLGPEDLDVRLRNVPVRDPSSIRLDREHRPTVHALVLDTSESMGGRLEAMRDAAREYVESVLQGPDKALVLTFDDSPVLLRGATGDREAIVRALDDVRLGATTQLLDAVHETILELESLRERPVILLVTDGVDTMSLHQRDDVLRIATERQDLTVFSISLGSPSLGGMGPSGMLSSRSFLEKIAERTNGEYFATLSAGGLDRIYRRIRDVLDSEATLSVVDPGPEGTRGKLEVRSRVPECEVKIAREARGPVAGPYQAAFDGAMPVLPYRLPVPTDPRVLAAAAEPERARSACGPEGSGLRIEADRIGGCYIDLTMERGVLYDPFSDERLGFNTWIDLTGKVLDIPFPKPADLPARLEDVLDRVAEEALVAQATPAAPDPRKRPVERHAARFHEILSLGSGTSLFELRSRLAHGVYLIPGYREWVAAALRRETGRSGGSPSEADLTRLLSAWLGDVPASELFARWEERSIERLLRSDPDALASDRFLERWYALRKVLWVPSYARILTLLSPVRDDASGRIGYYRIVLPRPAWLLPRLQDWHPPSDWADLPTDLVPDAPLGYVLVRRLLEERPQIATILAGDLASRVEYEPLGKPVTLDPDHAFSHCRVRVVAGTLRFTAEVDRGSEPSTRRVLAFDATESGELQPLLREASSRFVESGDR